MSRGLHLVLALVVLPGALLAQTTARFADHFVDRTMRVDYYHAGNAEVPGRGHGVLLRLAVDGGSHRLRRQPCLAAVKSAAEQNVHPGPVPALG